MKPKIVEELTKNYEAVKKIMQFHGLNDVFFGTMFNIDAKGQLISSQNTSSSVTSDEEQVDDAMEVSDDETLGNLNEDDDEQARHESFKSRSTIY